MAVTPIYELDIPAPYDVLFVHGEKALSVAPTIDGAASRVNYHLARWAVLEGGEYLLRVIAESVSSWATAVTQFNHRMFFYTKRDAGPHEATIFMPRGLQRIDLLISNLNLTAGRCYIAFSMHRQGKLVYASSAEGWVFNALPDAIQDSEIPGFNDPRTYIPTFTLLPNWEGGIIERITYSTEILASETDTEQRRSLRLSPRRSFEVSFARSNDRRTRIDSFLGGVGKNEFLMPMWHEQYPLPGVLGGTLVFPGGTLAAREFIDGMFCLVMAKNPNVYEILIIDTVNIGADTITFVAPPVSTWDSEARIFPLRIARIIEQSTLSNRTDAVGTTQIAFEVLSIDPPWFTASWGGERLFTFKPDRATDIAVTYDRVTAFVLDGPFGPIDVHDTEQKGRIVITGALHFRGRAALRTYRRFIDMARGRAVRFWMPSFTTDFQLVSDVSGSQIDVKSVGFTDLYRTVQDFRSALMIEFNNGQITLYRNIFDAEELDAQTERIYLETPVVGATIANVRRISFLIAVRFDQDTFELQHLVDGSVAVRTAFVARSTDATGMFLPDDPDDPDDPDNNDLDPQYILTSPLYPIEVVESFNASEALALNGYFTEPVDNIDVEATLANIALEVVIVYQTQSMDPDEINVTADLISGLLETVIEYETHTTPPDAIDVNGTLLSATLLVVINYITHLDPGDDEGIDVNATLLGGTLV